MKKMMAAVLCLVSGLASSVALADESKTDELIINNLKQVDSRIQVESINSSPLNGMKEVELDSGEVLYADKNGEYFLIGQLYRFNEEAGFVNLTEERAKAGRAEKLAAIADAQKVVYAPEGEVKATVNIFTDVDCPYCRKLHEEIPELNKRGIQVNYLAFPRSGAGTPSHHTMVSIWCAKGAEGKRIAMDNAKTGKSVTPIQCENNVLAQMALGQELGVRGTPAMVFEDGSLVPGYIPAARLSAMLGVN